MQIILVNENDEAIGAEDSRAIDPGKNIYRVAALWLTNPRGEVLLARRAENKRISPGKWGPAVAGTLEPGETYDSNIVKEMEEEIGLRDQVLFRKRKHRRRGERNYFGQWYWATSELEAGEFQLQESEVAAVRWFSEKEIRELIRAKTGELIPSFYETGEEHLLVPEPLDPPKFVLKPEQKDYTDDPHPRTVNCILQCGEEILLVKRNSKMKTYPGYWTTITGYLDDDKDPIGKAREELAEEAAIENERVLSYQEAAMVPIEDPGSKRTWLTHPILAKIDRKGVILDWEAEDAGWIRPEEAARFRLVPGFDRVLGSFFKI